MGNNNYQNNHNNNYDNYDNHHHNYHNNHSNNNRNYNKETVIRKKWSSLQNIPDISATNAVDNDNASANFCAKEQKKIQADAKRRWGGANNRDNVTEAAAATADSSGEGGGGADLCR